MARPRQKPELKPVTFVPLRTAFDGEVLFQSGDRDLNGWVNKRTRVKWELPAGRRAGIPYAMARVFEAKGYGRIVDLGSTRQRPVSEDELAELTAKDAVVGLGGQILG